jgi:hypothetical protein
MSFLNISIRALRRGHGIGNKLFQIAVRWRG